LDVESLAGDFRTQPSTLQSYARSGSLQANSSGAAASSSEPSILQSYTRSGSLQGKSEEGEEDEDDFPTDADVAAASITLKWGDEPSLMTPTPEQVEEIMKEALLDVIHIEEGEQRTFAYVDAVTEIVKKRGLAMPMEFGPKKAKTGDVMNKARRQQELRESIATGVVRLQMGGNLPQLATIAQASQDAMNNGKLSTLMANLAPEELNDITTACGTGSGGATSTRYIAVSQVVYKQQYQVLTELETQIKTAKNLLQAATEMNAVNEFCDQNGTMSWVGVTTKISKLLSGGGGDMEA
jgi:hypothetical protein